LRRITKAALGGAAGCALVLGATQWAAGASDLTTLSFERRLIDVLDGDDGPFDGAKATLKISETTGGSTFTVSIRGIDPSAAAAVDPFGAHVHTGSCVNRDWGGSKAGPHYKHDVNGPVDTTNEVWFDIVPNLDGTAIAETWVPFVVDPGADKERSIVIHVGKTVKEAVEGGPPVGSAGARQACLPIDYEDQQ
jgi:Cu/Zn superoxide dismutase